jgi:hypothetical protein
MSRHLDRLLACFSLALAVVTILLQRLLHQLLHQSTNIFQAVNIDAATEEQYAAVLADQTREFQAHMAALTRRFHIEMTALTIVVLVTFYVLFKRRGIQGWTRFIVLASATATCIGLFLAW